MRMTLDRKQLPDFTERKPELLRLLDKFEVGDLPLLIKPIASLRPLFPSPQGYSLEFTPESSPFRR
jgi:hypothetical protein